MNKKYIKYINYIVNDIQPPYFKNMEEMYGLRPEEYELVLSKLYDEPVTVKGYNVFDQNGNVIYHERSNGYWVKREYNSNCNVIYFENSNGHWFKREYDSNGNEIYYEDSEGEIRDYR